MEEVKFNSPEFQEFKKEFKEFAEKNPAFKLNPSAGKIALGWDKLTKVFEDSEKDEHGEIRATVIGTAFSPIKTEDKPSGWIPCSFKINNSIFAVNAPTLFNGCGNADCPSTVIEFIWWWKNSKGSTIKISKCENGDEITLSEPIRANVKGTDGKRSWQDVSTMKPKIIEWH